MMACTSPFGTARERPRIISCSAMETCRLLMDNWFISRERKYSQFGRICERRNSRRYWGSNGAKLPRSLGPLLPALFLLSQIEGNPSGDRFDRVPPRKIYIRLHEH